MLLGMKWLWLPLFLSVITIARLPGQLADADDDIKAKCSTYLRTPVPIGASNLAVRDGFPDCDSVALYYGNWKTPPNFRAAAVCAWKERAFNLSEKGQPPTDANTPVPFSQIYGGSAILVNIYANGLGVKRNIPLALRFTCEAYRYESPGDVGGAIRALEDLENKPVPQSKKDYFKMCDFQGSTPTSGSCANWDEWATNEERNRTLMALTKEWGPTQLSALAQLRIAAEAYYYDHAGNELNTAGTARAIEAIEELGTYREAFGALIASAEKGGLPKVSRADLIKTEAVLNRDYRQVLANAGKHKSEYGAVQPEGIRETERAWLRYRDAWVAFAKLRYPSVRAESWLTLLTKDRIVTLQSTLNEIGD
jgi:uncharacterized protein YecT (DUF1311 family)